MATFGDRVRDARKAKGWTQDELGQKAGLGNGTISRWERGAELNPTRTAVGAVARALGLDVDSLLSGDRPAASPLPATERVRTAIAELSAALAEWEKAQLAHAVQEVTEGLPTPPAEVDRKRREG